MQELDLVVLTRSIAEYGLEAGDIGTILHVYQGRAAYEVEFVTAEGVTVAVLTLTGAEVCPRASREILHIPELAPAE